MAVVNTGYGRIQLKMLDSNMNSVIENLGYLAANPQTSTPILINTDSFTADDVNNALNAIVGLTTNSLVSKIVSYDMELSNNS